MIKLLIFGLILVHATIQVEVAPEADNGDGSIEPKKFHKEHKKDWEGSQEVYKKEKKHKKYDSEFDNGKWKKEKKHEEWKRFETEGEDNGKVHKEKRNKEKSNKEKKEYRHRRENQLITADVETAEKAIDMSKDVDVNKGLVEVRTSDVEKVSKKQLFYEQMPELDFADPPSPNDTYLMARYIVHTVDWAGLATVTKGNLSPFANVVSMSDGPVKQGSGVPFFYLTPMDLSSKDLQKDNKASVTMTLAQTDYCRNETLDPQDPRCARVILTGKIKHVQAGSTEEKFAKDALFSRHPSMRTWPTDHKFFFAKMKIGEVILLDQFGGAQQLSVKEYIHPPTPK